MSYQETIQQIREARKTRDDERHKLYKALINNIALKKQQKKFERGETGLNQAGSTAIDALRNEIAKLQQELREAEERIAALKRLPAQLEIIKQQVKELKQKLQDLQDALHAIEEQLNRKGRAEQRQKLFDEIRELQIEIRKYESELSSRESELEKTQREIDRSANELGRLEEKKRSLESVIADKQGDLQRAISQALMILPDKTEEISAASVNIRRQLDGVKIADQTVAKGIGGLLRGMTEDLLIQNWNDDIPILLFPVRIETKYKFDADRAIELLVRVFPDDISIVSHEKELTKTEVDLGPQYWKALFNAGDKEQKKKDAWRVIAEKLGPNRAAWVVKQMQPTNWKQVNELEDEDGLVFPVIDFVKPDSWTEAPHSRVMPDRFVLKCYDVKNNLLHTATGKQIKDILVCGPAPVIDADGNTSLSRDTDTNRVKFDPEFNWTRDFNTAVEEGMGFRIPLTDVTRNGFDKILVVGLKFSANDSDGKQLLEDLIDSHHYSKNGFTILRQGTPTNNTEEADAGFNSKDILQEISYYTETGNAAFELTNDKFKKTDGQRMAEYLGIDYEKLHYVANAGLLDHAQAIAMNAALCAGTLDYYFYRMLSPVTSNETNQQIRNHFVNYVTGRGPLASIRVGNQPYGLLLTSSSPVWKYPGEQQMIHGLFQKSIYPALLNVLNYFNKLWKLEQNKLVKINSGGDAGDNLMKVLGLHPTSIEYYQRLAHSLDHVVNDAELMKDKYVKSALFTRQLEQEYAEDILRDLNYKFMEDGKSKQTPLLFQLLYHRYHSRLGASNLIDDKPLSETERINPYNKATKENYIHWLIKNADNHEALQKQDFGDAVKPDSMLFLMLHFSLLTETGHAIGKFLAEHDILATELMRSKKTMNLSTSPSVSPWEIFRVPVNLVVPTEVSTKSLYAHVHSLGPQHQPVVEDLKQQKAALEVLKEMKTGELERAMAEHIDTLSYRLDSWQQSLFEQRLAAKRNNAKNEERKTGIYLGCYGYLENSRPATGKRQPVSENILPEELREGTGDLYMEKGNGGYIQAPSLNHATAAAIVRNGYLSHANPMDKELLSVNLSSERVRRGYYLIEGLRNGQTLEALLGYQFERGMHDYSTRTDSPIILNQLVPFFRKIYPLKKTKVPQKGNITGPVETIDDYHVVNGISIVDAKDDFPNGLAGLPVLSTNQTTALAAIRKNIINTLDAFHDILVAESAYQMALGNFDRAAAVVQAISNSQLLPEIEVVNTPRGVDLALTNRFVVHFAPAMSNNPWEAAELTQRAIMEGGINNWVATLLPDPAKVKCKIKTVITPPEPVVEGFVSLAGLGIQPIDFIYLLRKKMETGFSELESRIRHAFLRDTGLPDSTNIQIDFSSSPGPGLFSFGAVLPLASQIKELITNARPLLARDYESGSKELVKQSGNPDNIDTAELMLRVKALVNSFEIIVGLLNNAAINAATIRTTEEVDKLREQLVAVANAGMVDAFPNSSTGNSDDAITVLTVQVNSVISRFNEFKKAYDAQLLKLNDPALTPSQQLELLTVIARGILGADFMLLPRFVFNNIADISEAVAHKSELLQYYKGKNGIPSDDLVVDEWLHGASLTRKRLRTFEMMRMINDTINEKPVEYAPIQIPYVKKDNWIAIEFPAGTSVVHDTISVVQYAPQGFEVSATQCGLVVDDWTEFIPGTEETTGISFNYNQPNSAPPQAILLAVAPEDADHWQWDHLLSTVLDTFERAKLRAIEPDMVDKINGVTTLLPAILAEFSMSENNVSLDYALKVKEVANTIKDQLLSIK